MKTWTVYKHTSPSGKVYVGITSNVKNRWCGKGAKYCDYNSIFKRAIEKYGWDNIKHEIVLEGIDKSEAIYAEKYLIGWYKSCGLSYNITDGGEGICGMKFSEDSIKKAISTKIANKKTDYLVIDSDFNYRIFSTIKAAAEYLGGVNSNISHILNQPIGYTFKKHYILRHRKNMPVDIESIKEEIQAALVFRSKEKSEKTKASQAMLIAASKEAIARMSTEERKIKFGRSNIHLGRHCSEETKKKMSLAAKGRDMSKVIEASRKCKRNTPTKAIVQIDLENNVVNEFPSINAATIFLGKASKSISNCLQGRSNTAFGYKWKYKSIGDC